MKLSFHPQTSGQTKRVNRVLSKYFKNYMGVDHRDYGNNLGMAKFYYNSIMHTTLKMSLFELVLIKKNQEAYGPNHSHGEEGSFQINHKNERA